MKALVGSALGVLIVFVTPGEDAQTLAVILGLIVFVSLARFLIRHQLRTEREQTE